MKLLWAAALMVVCMTASAHAVGVKLDWMYTQGATPASTFQVYRQPACTGAFVALASLPVATLTYTDSAVIPGSTYCWEVTARASTGEESTPSNVVSFRVPQALPQGPTSLSISLIP